MYRVISDRENVSVTLRRKLYKILGTFLCKTERKKNGKQKSLITSHDPCSSFCESFAIFFEIAARKQSMNFRSILYMWPIVFEIASKKIRLRVSRVRSCFCSTSPPPLSSEVSTFSFSSSWRTFSERGHDLGPSPATSRSLRRCECRTQLYELDSHYQIHTNSLITHEFT